MEDCRWLSTNFRNAVSLASSRNRSHELLPLLSMRPSADKNSASYHFKSPPPLISSFKKLEIVCEITSAVILAASLRDSESGENPLPASDSRNDPLQGMPARRFLLVVQGCLTADLFAFSFPASLRCVPASSGFESAPNCQRAVASE